jgi:hypothetical protein
MWVVFVAYALALAGVGFQLVAYSRMPARIPMHTGPTGQPGPERMSRRVVLITPVVFGIICIAMPLIFSGVPTRSAATPLQEASPAIVLVAVTWFVGATFWDIAAVGAGRKTRMPLILIVGGLIVVTVMMAAINLSRPTPHI